MDKFVRYRERERTCPSRGRQQWLSPQSLSQVRSPCSPQVPLPPSSLLTIWSSVGTAAEAVLAESSGSHTQVELRRAAVMASATSSSSTSTASSLRGRGTRSSPSPSSATTVRGTTGTGGSPAAGTSGSTRISAGSELHHAATNARSERSGQFPFLDE